ncbi:hypothetical protein [Nitratireductor sp. XY-223]|uniref:hypothetical protein n=1 Tax=Nitratireductor sp. XY-223 TaxID=2561926 RepID=UPI0010AB2CF1|nr:hypothetical protein [Nitratireductor sp. XY-223]
MLHAYPFTAVIRAHLAATGIVCSAIVASTIGMAGFPGQAQAEGTQFKIQMATSDMQNAENTNGRNEVPGQKKLKSSSREEPQKAFDSFLIFKNPGAGAK